MLDSVEPETLLQFCLTLWLIAVICLALRRCFRRRTWPWVFRARVEYVCDGDSVWVRTQDHRRIKLRLLGMDAPETDQPYGETSQKVLEQLILNQEVCVTAIHKDIYGRLVSAVELNQDDICLKMIELGMAWPYFRFYKHLSVKNQQAYTQAWKRAKKAKKGLWSEQTIMPPWAWRAQHRSLWERFILWLRRLFGWF